MAHNKRANNTQIMQDTFCAKDNLNIDAGDNENNTAHCFV